MRFKILFPTGYQIKDIYDDNIDINIVTSNQDVFFGTLFTLPNINKLSKSDGHAYFWATDMVILRDLNKSTIKEAISQIINDHYLSIIFSKIGTIKSILNSDQSFEDIKDCV